MPLISSSLKAKFKDTIFQGLKREFRSELSRGEKYSPIGEEMLMKIASAVSDIAVDIVTEIQSNAQVVPGIPVATVGSPSAQSGATTGPGKIM